MRFRDFLQFDEVGTSTSCIAGFKRIAIPNVRRIFPPELGFIDPEEKKDKKNPYRVPQLEENFSQVSQLTKQTASQMNQLARQIEMQGDPSDRQLVTLLKTASSTQGRLGDQYVQIDNMMKQRMARTGQKLPLNQMNQMNQNQTNFGNALNSFGNSVIGAMNQGGSLSQDKSVA